VYFLALKTIKRSPLMPLIPKPGQQALAFAQLNQCRFTALNPAQSTAHTPAAST
jgi:hypothetical protein